MFAPDGAGEWCELLERLVGMGVRVRKGGAVGCEDAGWRISKH